MSKKKKVSGTPKSSGVVLTGKLDISKGGMGFVIVEGGFQDILVKPNDFGKAFDGDLVKVEITPGRNGRRSEGKIVEVLERNKTEFIGSIETNGNVSFFIPEDDKLPDFYIAEDWLNGAIHDDKVVVRFLKWEKSKNPEGKVIQVIQAKDANDMAMKMLLAEHHFPLEFDEVVLKEADKLEDRILREELRKRRDCRDTLTFTIDPVDARDFDDALSIRNMDNGNYEIGVHITDVSYYVREGSLLDQAAYERATSVYFPDRVNPMLPEKISNELCSLRPNEDKLCFSVIFQITNRAEIKSKWMGRTIIHSNHRFTYEEVQQTIEQKEGLHFKAILLLNDLAKKLRKERFQNGAINFSSQEVRFVLDENAKPVGIQIKESKDAHKLIEEFMLLANRTVAEYVSKIKINKAPIPFPYRIHDTPDEEKLKMFVAFARKFGYDFDAKDERAVAKSFNKLLEEVHGKPEQHVLEQIGIRTMAKAKYTIENIGHYGLGFENYCHFTSPIRRYPDILTHRILLECLEKNVKPDNKMEQKCVHASERERAAMEAERAANKYKQVEYMQPLVGENFDSIISGVSHFGFWTETVEQKCEGLVSIQQLNLFDDFRHDPENFSLVGQQTGKIFRMGDAVRVKLVAANLDKRQLDFEWITDIKSTNKKATGKAASVKTVKKGKK
jgi:ribonuclease R